MIPKITVALNGWETPMIFIKVQQTQNSKGYTTLDEKRITFKGVIQPFKPAQLEIKPTEQRTWNWFWLHTRTNLQVSTNDRILYNNTRYKIMAQNDYGLNNYYEYQLVQDYE